MQKFLNAWQHIPEHTSPILARIGALEIRYYGLMYGLVFLVTYALVLYRAKHEDRFHAFSPELIQLCMIVITVGAVLGARVGYVLFYNVDYFFSNPLEIISPVHVVDGSITTGFSGMSYHGGLIGAALGALLITRIKRLNFWNLADLIAPVFPLGFTFGRIGNFFNGELWGRETTFPLGMYFPNSILDGSTLVLRHASQLYEALLEGVLLFVVLWSLRKTKQPNGFLFGLYLIGYGVMRTIAELFREPDAQLGFIFLHITMGQLLSSLMVCGGLAIIISLRGRFRTTS